MERYNFLNKADRVNSQIDLRSRINKPEIIKHNNLSNIRNRNQTLKIIQDYNNNKIVDLKNNDNFIIG
jgi:hypothetical protein